MNPTLYLISVSATMACLFGLCVLVVLGEREKKRPSDQRSWIGRFFG